METIRLQVRMSPEEEKLNASERILFCDMKKIAVTISILILLEQMLGHKVRSEKDKEWLTNEEIVHLAELLPWQFSPPSRRFNKQEESINICHTLRKLLAASTQS
jgi:hypothetical protein